MDFNYDLEREREVARRRRMLGELLNQPECTYAGFALQSRQTYIPPKFLIQWHKVFHGMGNSSTFDDELTLLDDKAWRIARERRQQLLLDDMNGDVTAISIIDAEEFPKSYIQQLQEKHDWTEKLARQRVRRYRAGGLWALVPGKDPFPEAERNRDETDNIPDVSLLTDEEWAEVEGKLALLGPLAHQVVMSNQEVADRVAELQEEGISISPRTLRYIHADLRTYGKGGLIRKKRADRQNFKNISDRMIEIVKSIRLSIPRIRTSEIIRRIQRIAVALGENAPSRYQIDKIVNDIPEPIRLLADGNEDAYVSQYRITTPIRDFDSLIIYQADHTTLDIVVKDLREKPTESGEVRPYLTLFQEARSRLILGWVLSYDTPDRFVVGAALRMALISGGIPHAIWVDQGKAFLAGYIVEIIEAVSSKHNILPPHQPQLKGRVERIFGTINTRLLETLPGYVSSNTKDRPQNVKAKLTITQLYRKLHHFITKEYNHEPHSSLEGSTPYEYWYEYCSNTRDVNKAHLNELLMEGETRVVDKRGIRFKKQFYFHSDLANLVGETVLIRSPLPYVVPSSIEVFHNRHHICTAHSIDSEHGRRLVSRNQIDAVQKNQRKRHRAEINQAKGVYKKLEQEIGSFDEDDDKPTEPQASPEEPPKTPPVESQSKDNDKSSKGDITERMGDDEDW